MSIGHLFKMGNSWFLKILQHAQTAKISSYFKAVPSSLGPNAPTPLFPQFSKLRSLRLFNGYLLVATLKQLPFKSTKAKDGSFFTTWHGLFELFLIMGVLPKIKLDL